MRVCDKCREPIDHETKYRVEIECFNGIGQFIASKSYNLELCSTCYEKYLGRIECWRK